MSVIRLCLVLHNHQPVGNFEGVIEQAYQDSYLPFLEVFEQYPQLKISLHTSGPLLEWLDANHPDYLDRLAALVAVGRLEIVGGAFYEPILTMLPSRDRIGQIKTYRRVARASTGGEGARHVAPRACVGAIADTRSGRRRHGIHGVGRFALPQCGPHQRTALGRLPDRR